MGKSPVGTFLKIRHFRNFAGFRRLCHVSYHPPLDRGRYRKAEKHGPEEVACGHCRRAWSICWGAISESTSAKSVAESAARLDKTFTRAGTIGLRAAIRRRSTAGHCCDRLNSLASQPTASVFLGSTGKEGFSTRWRVEHSNVRSSRPRFPGEIRANPNLCLQVGHIRPNII